MAFGSQWLRQAAAIPIQAGRVCLVTSSNGKRWVVPKGTIEPGQSAGETALLEAWEEAGLVGLLETEPIGSYLYEKWGDTYHVTVFVMHVSTPHGDWPERDRRQRTWLAPEEAISRIVEPDLQSILRAVFQNDRPTPALRVLPAPAGQTGS